MKACKGMIQSSNAFPSKTFKLVSQTRIDQIMTLSIKLLISDIDGVMTDGGIYYTEGGERFKKFSVYDTMGFTHLHENGIKSAIIYAEQSPIVETVANDLGIKHRYENVTQKYELAKQLCEQENIELENLAFIGDDTNDIELMENCGLAACPSNAPKEIRNIINVLVLKRPGGEGAVREFIDYIIENGFFEKSQ